MNKKEKFIEKSRKVHGDVYDYSKVEYIDSLTKVCIICPEHGEFWQTPQGHVRGYGCPKCSNSKKGKKLTFGEFFDRAKEVHGDKYDYSKVKYNGFENKVCIICPEHGEFWQTPNLHLNGCGCPKCVGRNMSNDEIKDKFNKIHGDKYDYSNVLYTKNNIPIEIICREHGAFYQLPYKHMIGHGCPKCGLENRIKKQFSNKETFIKKAKEIHGDKYDYSKVEYISMRDKVCIICHEHGEFWQFPFDHINEHGCPKCGIIISKSEEEIYNELLKYFKSDEIIKNDRKVLDGKEIDIYIPSKKIGIEYNGLKWHSEEFGKDKYYHIDKTKLANEKNIKLIQIFEDEYINHRDIVLNKIKHLLGINGNISKIPGRKCVVKEIDRIEAKEFLDKYHIQGYGKCTISLGCFYNDILIGIMSFLKHSDCKWELVRFATNYNYICQGVGGKLFKYFVNSYNPIEIKTFADRRWTINNEKNLYTELGFVNDGIIGPEYRYVNTNLSKFERIHKFNFRKRSIHKKYGLPLSMSESEMVKKLGYYKIWDCGLIRYKWYKKGE